MEKVGREVKKSKKEEIGNRERVERKVWAEEGIGSERRKGKIHIYTEYNKMDKRKTTGKGYRAV